jgi:16S rRNA (guanine527-N7)-methyltransferase|tara:strand:+ start:212686 stop:213339 length:654 start_codon:yes stop_codon:yes gene_type:complete
MVNQNDSRASTSGLGLSGVDVSRETDSKLQAYDAMLHKWQKAVNIVSPSTLSDSLNRHFVDSLQILPLLPKNTKTLYDLGSGGGFPGMVLAIAAPDIEVSLIESDRKKCSFLSSVSRETLSPTTVVNTRIESAALPAPDVVTARALADLTQIFTWCLHWAEENPNLTFLLPKGRNVAQEIADAEEKFSFDYEQVSSKTSDESSIIIVYKLRTRLPKA